MKVKYSNVNYNLKISQKFVLPLELRYRQLKYEFRDSNLPAEHWGDYPPYRYKGHQNSSFALYRQQRTSEGFNTTQQQTAKSDYSIRLMFGYCSGTVRVLSVVGAVFRRCWTGVEALADRSNTAPTPPEQRSNTERYPNST